MRFIRPKQTHGDLWIADMMDKDTILSHGDSIPEWARILAEAEITPAEGKKSGLAAHQGMMKFQWEESLQILHDT